MAQRKRRTFTPELKTEVVLEALHGESSQAEVCIGLNKRWHFIYSDVVANSNSI